MSKIVITSEQKKAVETALTGIYQWKKNPNELINYFAKAKQFEWGGFASKELRCLNSLDVSELARIVYVEDSYEIEKPFVECPNCGFEVESLAHMNTELNKKSWYVAGGYGNSDGKTWHFVHNCDVSDACSKDTLDYEENIANDVTDGVEDEDEKLFAKFDRKPWELKMHDLLSTSNGKIIEFFRYDQGAIEYCIDGKIYRTDILGFKDRHRIACFAESRWDVNNNE